MDDLFPTPYRLTVLCPADRVEAARGWYAANVGPGETFPVGLSKSGEDPAEYYWTAGVLTAVQLGALMTALCAGSGIAPPAKWLEWTHFEQVMWLSVNLTGLEAASGYKIVIDDQTTGRWTFAEEILEAQGLIRIQPPMPELK